MNIAPVAYRYARSLMELAQEKGVLAGVHEDMRLVADACAANRDLVLLLKSPVVKADTKEKILHKVFVGKVGQLTATFMDILVRKGRNACCPMWPTLSVRCTRCTKASSSPRWAVPCH